MAATLSSWFYPENMELKYRLVISFTVVLFILVANYVELICRHKKQTAALNKLKSELEDTKTKHTALARQYDMKQIIINDFEQATYSIKHLLSLSIANKKDLKFDALAEGIMFQLNNIEKE